jgi:hypothetical protein
VFLMAMAEAETGARPEFQSIVLLLSALGLVMQMQFRPQLFTFTFVAAISVLLARDNFRGRAPLWLAVPMLALWANLHGGFFVGIVVLGIYVSVKTTQDLAAGRGWQRGVRPGLITLAALLVTLLNPYGLGLWQAVAHALRNPLTRSFVLDWQPLIRDISINQTSVIFHLCAFAVIASLAIAVLVAPHGDDLPLVAIAAVMVVAAFISVRNVPLAVVSAGAPLARRAELFFGGRLRATGGATELADMHRPSWLLHQAVQISLAAALFAFTSLFSPKLQDGMRFPAGAVAFIKEHNLRGNVLCHFGWGEYLIWHTAPQSKVFIDGRYDTVYPPKIIKDYMRFEFKLPGAVRVLKSYPHDLVLIRAEGPAYEVMASRREWKPIYRDRDSVLFARSSVSLPAMPTLSSEKIPDSYFPN